MINNESDEFWSISDSILSIENVGGHQKTKKYLLEVIEYMSEYSDIIYRWGPLPSRGFLLWGPPGCQKDKLIEGIASKTNAKLIKIYVKFN